MAIYNIHPSAVFSTGSGQIKTTKIGIIVRQRSNCPTQHAERIVPPEQRRGGGRADRQ